MRRLRVGRGAMTDFLSLFEAGRFILYLLCRKKQRWVLGFCKIQNSQFRTPKRSAFSILKLTGNCCLSRLEIWPRARRLIECAPGRHA